MGSSTGSAEAPETLLLNSVDRAKPATIAALRAVAPSLNVLAQLSETLLPACTIPATCLSAVSLNPWIAAEYKSRSANT